MRALFFSPVELGLHQGTYEIEVVIYLFHAHASLGTFG